MLIVFYMNAADLAINRKWLKRGVLNPAYRELKNDMAADIRRESQDHHTGDVQVTINFAGSQCDVDAPLKAPLDILEKARIFKNDSQVRRLVVEITDRKAKPWYGIEVVPYKEEE